MSAAALNEALELIQANNPGSLERALGLLQSTIYSFGMKVCGHPEDAEDTMQEVLIKALPYLPKFESSKTLAVWLYKVARNRCLMNRRGAKNARHKHFSLEELMPSPAELEQLASAQQSDPEAELLRKEGQQRLREALSKVPPLYRMVLVLHDMEGLNTSEVARVIGVREGTVRVRLHRARLFLRQQLTRREKAKGVVVDCIHASADQAPGKRPSQCREMFAALSDYMDGLVDDKYTHEMEKHLNDCKPCVAFLESLKSAVQLCRTYEPTCDTMRAEKLRQDLLGKYQAAVASLPKEST